MNGVGRKVGFGVLVLFGLFAFGVIAAWVGPMERVTAVNGTAVTCQEKFRTDHTRIVQVSKDVAKTTDVGDKCPA